MERDLGAQERWVVRISISSSSGYTSSVEVLRDGVPFESSGSGADGVLATWDAMGRVEQLLRERRGLITPHVERESK